MASRVQVTPVALAVLELLHERPMHPYEMHQTMRIRHTDRIVKLNAGTLYHTVERLDRLGLVEVAETSRAGRRPERTVYALTPAGKEMFAQRVVDMLANPAEEYPEYAHAVALAHSVDRDSVLSELRHRQGELEALLAVDQGGVERLERMELPRRFWLDV
ncbi:MAG TPA: helix-turn-helix transcriptional regulator, partial [Actinopolymorphaceae bacterium]|nr:helix-turn-helix transcriptional regulator [Actinopolymorphaceae bacterium]